MLPPLKFTQVGNTDQWSDPLRGPQRDQPMCQYVTIRPADPTVTGGTATQAQSGERGSD